MGSSIVVISIVYLICKKVNELCYIIINVWSVSTMNADFSVLTQVAIDAAQQAGVILRNGFGKPCQISLKPGIQNFVTEYDYAAERLIMDIIHTKFPDHGFLCEESGASYEGAEVIWIIDPLDGTANFTRQIPIFSISIAALGPKGLITGVIYQPMSGELFLGETGKGSYLNNDKMFVSKSQTVAKGIAATGFPRDISSNPMGCIEHFIKILKLETTIRNFGSSALNMAYVAAGRFDAYWSVSLHPWDFAAAALLIKEAGGKCTTYDGTPLSFLQASSVVATNGIIHEEMLQHLNN
jgi:myo-inositol-1(or 4)-monophosphatase